MSSQSIELFPELPRSRRRAATQAVLEHGRIVDVEEGAVLVRNGQAQPALYHVIEGACAVTLGAGDTTEHLGRLAAGDWVGKQSFFDPEHVACATVIAASPSRVLELRHEDFERLKRDDLRAAGALVRTLVNAVAARIRATNALLEAAQEAATAPSDGVGSPYATAERKRLLARAIASLSGQEGEPPPQSGDKA